MKKLLLAGATGVALIAGSANAADLGTRPTYKAPPPVVAPVPIFTWTGCYLGGHVGGGWGHKDVRDPTGDVFAPPGGVVPIDTSGFLGGGQVGCDWQFASSWVLGIEGMASWADMIGIEADAFFN